jgi:predicted protein tyrosine phosphatase
MVLTRTSHPCAPVAARRQSADQSTPAKQIGAQRCGREIYPDACLLAGTVASPVAVVGQQSAGLAMASSVTPTTGLGSWSAVILPADPNHEIRLTRKDKRHPAYRRLKNVEVLHGFDSYVAPLRSCRRSTSVGLIDRLLASKPEFSDVGSISSSGISSVSTGARPVAGRQSAGLAMASSVTPTTGLGSWSAVILRADPNHEIRLTRKDRRHPAYRRLKTLRFAIVLTPTSHPCACGPVAARPTFFVPGKTLTSH